MEITICVGKSSVEKIDQQHPTDRIRKTPNKTVMFYLFISLVITIS
jgi:hypothetical protein